MMLSEIIEGSCCENRPTRLVTYQIEGGRFTSYLVCDNHFEKVNDEGIKVWQRFAVSITRLRA